MEKRLALMIFYNDRNKILLQDRSNMSKWGEDWGYFGGAIDGDETPKKGIIREIQEVLKFEINSFDYLGKYEKPGKPLKNPSIEINVIQEVFVSKINKKEFDSMVLHEGAGMKWFSVKEAMVLNMYPLDPQILVDFERKYSN